MTTQGTGQPARTTQPERHGLRRFLDVAWQILRPVGLVLVALLVLLALVLIPAIKGETTKVQQNLSQVAGWQTSNFQGAGGAPLAGNPGVISSEERCIAGWHNAGMARR